MSRKTFKTLFLVKPSRISKKEKAYYTIFCYTIVLYVIKIEFEAIFTNDCPDLVCATKRKRYATFSTEVRRLSEQ